MADDLTQLLRPLRDTAPTFTAAPAADVRRRGAVLRRRRHALVAVAAAAAAVVAVAGPAALLAGRGADSAPGPVDTPSVAPTHEDEKQVPPAPPPDPGWSRIPDGFPLALGWPPASTEGPSFGLFGPEPGLTTLTDQLRLPCDGAPPDFATTDQVSALWKAPEVGLLRELMLFENDVVAAKYADGLRHVFEACPSERLSAQEEIRVDFTEAPRGFSAAIATVLGGTGTVHVSAVRLVQIGNRVLVATGSSEASDPVRAVSEVEAQLEGLLTALAVDDPERAASDPTTPSGTGSDIPADFPIAVDLGDWGAADTTVDGPGPDAEGVGLDLCGRPAWPTAADRLAVTATGPEVADARELRVWPSADDAVATMDRLDALLDSCRRIPTGAGPDRIVTRLDAETGWASLTFAITYEQGLGSELYQFTRVGRSVVVTMGYGEGSIETVALGIPRQSELSRRLAERMCSFTEAGC